MQEEEWFGHTEQKGVICIREKYYSDRANLWFFQQSNGIYILIDCGTGARDLFQYLLSSNLLPSDFTKLVLILTHQHNDHAGGVRHFHNHPKVEVCIHEDDAEAVRKGEDEVKWGNRGNMWLKKPCENWNADNFVVMEAGVKIDRLLKDRDNVEGLGIIHLPGHSPGCIAILDMEKRRIFTGDVVYERGLAILNFPSSNMEKCIDSMKKLQNLCKKFDFGYPGHFGVITPELIEEKCRETINLCKYHLNTPKK